MGNWRCDRIVRDLEVRSRCLRLGYAIVLSENGLCDRIVRDLEVRSRCLRLGYAIVLSENGLCDRGKKLVQVH